MQNCTIQFEWNTIIDNVLSPSVFVILWLLSYRENFKWICRGPGFHTIATASATVKAVATVAISTAPAKTLATKVHPWQQQHLFALVSVDTYSKLQQTFNDSREIHVLFKETETLWAINAYKWKIDQNNMPKRCFCMPNQYKLYKPWTTSNLNAFFCRLIDTLYFLASKRPFSILNVHLQSFCSEIFTDFYKVNLRTTFKLLVTFQDKHLLDWSSLDLLVYSDFTYEKNHVQMWVKYDHQAFVGRLFVHLSIINILHRIICLDHKTKHLNLIL